MCILSVLYVFSKTLLMELNAPIAEPFRRDLSEVNGSHVLKVVSPHKDLVGWKADVGSLIIVPSHQKSADKLLIIKHFYSLR